MIAALHTFQQVDCPEAQFGHAFQGMKRNVGVIATSNRRYSVDAKSLARNWSIGLETAQRTIDATTQRGVRTILHPTLLQSFRTNDRQLCYRRIAHDLFTDTLEATTTSWFRQSKYAQVFASSFGWVRIYPLKKKSEAHEALSLLAQRDGIPPTLIMDGSKEQTLGLFRKKAREMGCCIKQTEPYSPWQNAAESAIQETKRGAGRKASKAKSPAKLWDYCLELEAYIRSNTALDIFGLEGQVPETIISGQTADISPFVELAWYDWVYWWSTNSSYPNLKEVLGRWLRSSIDIGPAMTAKILKSNGQVVHLSTYCPLTESEQQDHEEIKRRDQFDKDVEKRLGSAISNTDLLAIGLEVPTPD